MKIIIFIECLKGHMLENKLVKCLKLAKNPNKLKKYVSNLPSYLWEELCVYCLEHAELHESQGHPGAARVFLNVAEQLAKKDDFLLIDVKTKNAKWYEKRGKVSEAMSIYNKLYEDLYIKNKDSARGGQFCMEMGILFSGSKKYHEAKQMFQKAADCYKKSKSTSNRLKALFNKSSVEYELGNIEESMNICVKILKEVEPLLSSDDTLVSNIYLQLANCYEVLDAESVAIPLYKQVLSRNTSASELNQFSNIAYRIGWLIMRKGAVKNSQAYLKLSYQIKIALDYAHAISSFNYCQGEVYRSIGLYDKAKRYYLCSLSANQAACSENLGNMARFGYYAAMRSSKLPFAKAMKLSPRNPELIKDILTKKGGYFEFGKDGAKLLPYRQKNAISPGTNRSQMINLLNDLSYCAEWLESKDQLFYKRQQIAVQNSDKNL